MRFSTFALCLSAMGKGSKYNILIRALAPEHVRLMVGPGPGAALAGVG